MRAYKPRSLAWLHGGGGGSADPTPGSARGCASSRSRVHDTSANPQTTGPKPVSANKQAPRLSSNKQLNSCGAPCNGCEHNNETNKHTNTLLNAMCTIAHHRMLSQQHLSHSPHTQPPPLVHTRQKQEAAAESAAAKSHVKQKAPSAGLRRHTVPHYLVNNNTIKHHLWQFHCMANQEPYKPW